jgi:hypothetical protein
MKSFHKLVVAAALLCSFTSGTPTSVPSIAVTITNELDGKAGTAPIPGDGRFRRVPDLFANTQLDQNGQFFGTIARLTHFLPGTRCLIRGDAGDLILNSSVPLIDLDGNPNVALLKPLVLNGFQVRCRT